jgi:hypothetical protein
MVVGNPTLNLIVWELYKSRIAGGKTTETKSLTTAKADKTDHFFGTVRKGSVLRANSVGQTAGKARRCNNRTG